MRVSISLASAFIIACLSCMLATLAAVVDNQLLYIIGIIFTVSMPLVVKVRPLTKEKARPFAVVTIYDLFPLLCGFYLTGIPVLYFLSSFFRVPIVLDIVNQYLIPGALRSGELIGALFTLAVTLTAIVLKQTAMSAWKPDRVLVRRRALGRLASSRFQDQRLAMRMAVLGCIVLTIGILAFGPGRYLNGYKEELNFHSIGWSIIAFADLVEIMSFGITVFGAAFHERSLGERRRLILLYIAYCLARFVNGARFFLIGGLLTALAARSLVHPFGLRLNFRTSMYALALFTIGISILFFRGSFSVDGRVPVQVAAAALTEPVFSTISFYNIAHLHLVGVGGDYGYVGLLRDFTGSLVPRFVFEGKVIGAEYNRAIAELGNNGPLMPFFSTPFFVGEMILSLGVVGGIFGVIIGGLIISTIRNVLWGRIHVGTLRMVLAFWLWLVVLGWGMINVMRQPAYIWLKIFFQYGVLMPVVLAMSISIARLLLPKKVHVND